MIVAIYRVDGGEISGEQLHLIDYSPNRSGIYAKSRSNIGSLYHEKEKMSVFRTDSSFQSRQEWRVPDVVFHAYRIIGCYCDNSDFGEHAASSAEDGEGEGQAD